MLGESGAWTARTGQAAERLRSAFAGAGIRKGIACTVRRDRTIQIRASTHILTVGRPQPDLGDALDRIHLRLPYALSQVVTRAASASKFSQRHIHPTSRRLVPHTYLPVLYA